MCRSLARRAFRARTPQRPSRPAHARCTCGRAALSYTALTVEAARGGRTRACCGKKRPAGRDAVCTAWVARDKRCTVPGMSSPAVLSAPAPAPSPLVSQRANAGEEVWHQLGLQFLWICIVQAVVIGACGASSRCRALGASDAAAPRRSASVHAPRPAVFARRTRRCAAVCGAHCTGAEAQRRRFGG